jgi:glycerol kinase
MCERFTDFLTGTKLTISTGIPLSTYFSAIKLRWMIDHHSEVHQAHEEDDLMFGTVDTWLVYVSFNIPSVWSELTSSP